MIRSRSIPLAVGKWITIASAILALGCATTQLINPVPEWNTPLPSGVSSNPKQFLNDVSMVRAADNVHIRARPGACFNCIVHVRIQALGETWRIDPKNGPTAGVPVAKIQNLDSSDREALYGFLPDTAAVYYFWVDRGPRSNARLTVLQVPVHGGVVTAGRQTDLRLCHRRPEGQPSTSDADFYEYRYHGGCTERVSSVPPRGMSEASLFPGAPAAALVARLAAIIVRGMQIADGGWIDCNLGCCT